ncbi:MAG: antitoxin, family [Burkholderiales bacterium]|jgi:RHH-type rel operon transcriptional repressor/antitoxin RelB|nr:antitoxin, family [Burkholderiales bacterium]
MLGVRLDKDTESRLNNLSKSTHRSKSYYVKAALNEYLDDLEDIAIAEQRLANIRAGIETTRSLEEVMKDLGI